MKMKKILFSLALILAFSHAATLRAEVTGDVEDIPESALMVDAIADLPFMSPFRCLSSGTSDGGITACLVNRGIALIVIENAIDGHVPPYPASLDSAANTTCSTANPCFGNVFETPVTSSNWTKLSATEWKYASSKSSKATTYVYYPLTGVFAKK